MRAPRKPRWTQWNHNVHYHEALLAEVPTGCRRALDVGCGAGEFAARLAERSEQVVGLDRNRDILGVAQRASARPNIDYVEGDLFTVRLDERSFDLIACICSLHHMPLAPALVRLRELLAPGGVIAVLGMYRHATVADFAHFAAVTGPDMAIGLVRSRHNPEVGPLPMPPLAPSTETMAEIRAEADRILPGAVVRRRMYYRYTLAYRDLVRDESGAAAGA
jgi:SAM-dependent methyltransferase